MHTYPEAGPGCVQQQRLWQDCAGSPESLLFTYVISTVFTCDSSVAYPQLTGQLCGLFFPCKLDKTTCRLSDIWLNFIFYFFLLHKLPYFMQTTFWMSDLGLHCFSKRCGIYQLWFWLLGNSGFFDHEDLSHDISPNVTNSWTSTCTKVLNILLQSSKIQAHYSLWSIIAIKFRI